MPEYSFVFAGRVGVGKSSLFTYIKNGMAPSEYSGDLSSGRRNEDYGLENLTYETKVNDREASVRPCLMLILLNHMIFALIKFSSLVP